jgi:hypothetical protein
MLFNPIHSVALQRVVAELLEDGVVLHATGHGGQPFWGTCSGDVGRAAAPGSIPVVEITYFDDECCMLAAKQPLAIDRAGSTLLAVLVSTFHEFGFAINWKRTKTEAIVEHRGRSAEARRARLAAQQRAIAVPPPPGQPPQRLHVVDRYKYLGSLVAIDNCVYVDADLMSSQAMQAYIPLARVLFGTESISRRVRLMFASSLVLSIFSFRCGRVAVRP